MLKVWGRPNSINVQKVMWMIAELGLEIEHEIAGLQHGKVDEDWYRAMNPNGRVPTIDDDGLVLWESNVIVRYLAAKHAMGTLMPAGIAERALAEMWMDWQQTTILPCITPVFWGLIRTPEAERDMTAIEAGAQAFRDAIAILDRNLADREYILGEKLTVADFPLGCVAYRWYGLPVEHGDFPNLRAWYERLAQRDTYRRHVMLPLT
jgi:glutathione S-transferase